MNRYCNRIYNKLCLDFSRGLTAKEEEQFLFYCRTDLPAGILEQCSVLKALTELEHRRVLLFENTSFLRQFLEDIGRLDLLLKAEYFDVSRQLIWLFEALVTSKIGRKLCGGPFAIENGYERNLLVENFVTHQEVDRLPILNSHTGSTNVVSLLVKFRERIIEQSESKGITWTLIPPLVKFASELAVSCYLSDCTAGVGEKIVVSICNQLVKDVIPWIANNGGWSKFEAFVVEESKIEGPEEMIEDGSQAHHVFLGQAVKSFRQFVMTTSGRICNLFYHLDG